MAATQSKVAIVGAGAVGATAAYACLIKGLARTVALYDIDAARVRAEVLDLQHGTMFLRTQQVIGSDDIAVCANADVVVITAGAAQRPGQTRMALADVNVGIACSVAEKVLAVAPNAILVPVTNPVDVVTYGVIKACGLPPGRVFGSGTVLDSSRLRALMSELTGISAAAIRSYIAGEHGDTSFALWSTAALGPIPATRWLAPDGEPLFTPNLREQLEKDVARAAYEVIAGKGVTNYAVGLAIAFILEAVLGDAGMIMPVSTLIEDFYGIGDVCLSLPTVVDRAGAHHPPLLPLDEHELERLRASADAIRAVIRSVGL